MATRSREKKEKRKIIALASRPTAHANYIRISPFKVRIVLDTIRGKSVEEALALLESTPKAASDVIYKLVKSASANAEDRKQLAVADLYVAECYADGGPILKRVMPRAQGRAFRINKRTSHITVVLDTIKEVK